MTTLSPTLTALDHLQLVLAGFALAVAAQQGAVWRWEGKRSTARAVVPAACTAAVVFFSNYQALEGGRTPAALDGWLFVRSVSLSLLAITLLPLAGRLSGQRVPKALLGLLVLVLAVRLTAWPTTHLLYRHRLVDGLPAYGPLTAPTGFLVIAIILSYLVFVTWRSSARERVLLGLGVAAALALAAITLLAPESWTIELVTGYVPFPPLISLAALTWLRQGNAFQTAKQLADRQKVLADLGHVALTADLATVEEGARLALAEHSLSPGPQGASGDEFATAVTAVVDATRARVDATEELRRRAMTDELTGLPNRASAAAAIDSALDGNPRADASLAVALCNIDRLREINDIFGHRCGDDVLQEVAHRLRGVARPGDTVARFDGDEFVVVCTGPPGFEAVTELERRLTGVFEQPVATNTVQTSITASIGIVTATAGGNSGINSATILRDAHTAMSDAKSRGGAVIGEFTEKLRSAVVYRADMERRLSGALDRGEIYVDYQPIVSLPARTIVGFEALARWQDGSAVLAPNDWIPIAEATGLIEPIGEHVLSEAMSQLTLWLAAGHEVGVSVNISSRQLASGDLVQHLARHLRPVPPGLLTLEITESLAVDDHAADLLSAARSHGVRVAIDDFGTGYSALGALSRLPIDSLKIDRSLVRRAGRRDGKAVLAAIMAIARSLEFPATAEGLETSREENVLLELGCTLGQGYLYYPPLSTEQTWDALAAGRV